MCHEHSTKLMWGWKECACHLYFVSFTMAGVILCSSSFFPPFSILSPQLSLSSALSSCQSGGSTGRHVAILNEVTGSSHEPPVDSWLLIIQSWITSPAVEEVGPELQVWLYRCPEWMSEQGWTECRMGNLANWKDLESWNIIQRR